MKICLSQEMFNPKGECDLVAEAYDTGKKVFIYYPNSREKLECNLYSFSGLNFNANVIRPFVCFCKNGVGIFCNDVRYAKYEYLDSYSQGLFRWYFECLWNNGYRGNFDQYIFAATPDKYDKDVTEIVWEKGSEFTYSFSRDYKTLYFTHDGRRTRMQCITALLNKLFKTQIQSYFEVWVSNLHLDGKVYAMKIDDPKSNSYTSLAKVTEESLLKKDSISPGTSGTNYLTDVSSDYRTLKSETRRKSYVVYSPVVYYLSPKEQKILIAHELVHCKIGTFHGHDSYFWYLFEYVTGYSRKDDNSYRPKQEANDTANWDRSALDPSETRIYGQTNDYLIERHQEAVENDEEW